MCNPVCVSLLPLRAPPPPTAEARGDKAKWVFTWPLIFLLCVTIPNCSKPRWEKYFMVTFITATLWIAVFSYLMVWLVSGYGSRGGPHRQPLSSTCWRWESWVQERPQTQWCHLQQATSLCRRWLISL